MVVDDQSEPREDEDDEDDDGEYSEADSYDESELLLDTVALKGARADSRSSSGVFRRLQRSSRRDHGGERPLLRHLLLDKST